MVDDELVALRDRVDCRAVLERAGWALDKPESTVRAAKYRHGQAQIIIVTHEGHGWFDPLNDGARGDVIALAQHLWGGTIGHARKALRPLAGIAPSFTPISKVQAPRSRQQLVIEWRGRGTVRPGSRGWTYLQEKRGLPVSAIDRAAEAGLLKEGVNGTIWAAHHDDRGTVCGWEMRGPHYRGFARDGAKTLFRVGSMQPGRIAVTESAIDALSLATLEGWHGETLYVSTGGGFGPATSAQLTTIAEPQARLVAAVDQGKGGELLAARLDRIAAASGCGFSRLRPIHKDWNEDLCARDAQIGIG